MYQKNEYWLLNTGKTDIILNDLGITIKSGDSLDVFARNKNLKSVHVRYSERYGSLKIHLENGKLKKVSGKIEKPKAPIVYKVADTPLFSRSRSCLEIDPEDKDFIEQLEDDFMKDTEELSEHELAELNERFVEKVDLDGFMDDSFIDEED